MLASLTEFSHWFDEVLRQIRDEYQIWGLAGAWKLLGLKLQGVAPPTVVWGV
jgi:hypothetical protein